MSTLNAQTAYTMLDLANEIGPDGSLLPTVEILHKKCPAWKDARWEEANSEFSNVGARELNLPAGERRLINRGVGYEAAHDTQFEEVMTMIEGLSKVDAKLAKVASGGVEAFRARKAKKHIRGMAQTASEAFFYDDASLTLGEMTGLKPRLDALSQDNVMGGSGTGSDLSSVYVVKHGEDGVMMNYPKGHKTLGIEHTPFDLALIDDGTGNGKKFLGYEDHFGIHMGMTVYDPMAIGRYCNIETAGSTNIFNPDILIRLLNEMDLEEGEAVIYMNSTIKSQLDILSKDKTNANYYPGKDLWGVSTMFFRGHPVRVDKNILNTETAVT